MWKGGPTKTGMAPAPQSLGIWCLGFGVWGGQLGARPAGCGRTAPRRRGWRLNFRAQGFGVRDLGAAWHLWQLSSAGWGPARGRGQHTMRPAGSLQPARCTQAAWLGRASAAHSCDPDTGAAGGIQHPPLGGPAPSSPHSPFADLPWPQVARFQRALLLGASAGAYTPNPKESGCWGLPACTCQPYVQRTALRGTLLFLTSKPDSTRPSTIFWPSRSWAGLGPVQHA